MPAFDKRDLLAGSPLFGQFRPDELNRLVSFLRVARYPARRVLFRKGDPGTNMMVVLEGRVQICTHSEEGREFVVNIINPGEVFGEIALLDGSDRTADAVTMDPCELMVLERRDFVPFLRDHPDACMRLLEVLCQKLRWTTGVLEAALFLEGPSRLARVMVHLSSLYGQPVSGGIELRIRLSQQQLANMVGMSRESINKQLGQWRDDGIVAIDEGRITITDLDALQEI
jgi:CRP/FNR family transcriptional regulator, cyclic AMP receptor protein